MDFTMRQFIAPLALHLKEHGWEVVGACSRGRYWDELEARGLKMVEMPIARSANPLRALPSLWRLSRWLFEVKPHVLHVHTPVAALLGRLAGLFTGVPVVVYTAHGFYFHDQMRPLPRLVYFMMEWLAAPLHTHLFCVSEEDARMAVPKGLGRKGDVFYVSNGVDSRVFNPERADLLEGSAKLREELGIPPNTPVLTTVGRLVRQKGYIELFEAAKLLLERHPQLHILVVGDELQDEPDRARAYLEGAAKAPELAGMVHFTGMREDVPALLALTDIFVQPSYREGLPTAVIEAMMMARPVVATRVRGNREAVRDGETGFLVDLGSVEELAGAVDYLLRNPSTAAEMGAAGRRRALANYELSAVLRKQYNLLRQFAAAVR
ncbi:MAG: glycosyltransferase family 4 protein [Candidatus Sumerlaeia bacterium]|nr:glycosyltransferase family 4 protein [Candidatus Sumerlaeia bacterium]